MKIYPDNENLIYSGRIDWSYKKAPVWVFPCTCVKIKFTGNQLLAHVKNKNAYWDNYLGAIVDGDEIKLKLPKEGEALLTIPLEPGKGKNGIHEVLLFKRQDSCHEVTFLGFEIEEDADILKADEEPKRKIEIYGDSVSAGEISEAVSFTGKEDPPHNGEYSNSYYSYGWILARKLGAQIYDIAQGGIALMDHMGWFYEPDQIGMETVWDKIHYNPIFGGESSWDFSKYTPQLVIVALGQNDSHPVDYMQEDYMSEAAERWREHYKRFLKGLRGHYPDANIICCTTLLNHDDSWDLAIDEVVRGMEDKKITHYLFKRNGCGTPGHLRIPEAMEMAEELYTYIDTLDIKGWD